jgi:hypothetical protein
MFTSTQSENPFKVFGAKIHMENIMFCSGLARVAQIKYIYLLDSLLEIFTPTRKSVSLKKVLSMNKLCADT